MGIKKILGMVGFIILTVLFIAYGEQVIPDLGKRCYSIADIEAEFDTVKCVEENCTTIATTIFHTKQYYCLRIKEVIYYTASIISVLWIVSKVIDEVWRLSNGRKG